MTRPQHIRITVATPCPVRWDDMRGLRARRHCDLCRRTVHDLSAMSSAEIERLIRFSARGQRPCVSFYQRADGTVLTADCGYPRVQARRGWLALIASLVAAALALLGTGDPRRTWWEGRAPGPSLVGPIMRRTTGVLTLRRDRREPRAPVRRPDRR